jgi:transposase, IS30 family
LPGAPLSAFERQRIDQRLRDGDTQQEIAEALGRAQSTIAREVARNGGADRYCPLAAEQRAVRCRRRPKTAKLRTHPGLGAYVTERLKAGDSPAVIAARLRRAGGPTVCAETIYRSLYHPGPQGVPLLASRCLRSRRGRRRPRATDTAPRPKKGRLGSDFRLIDTRPADAAGRRPGHWEGDLIIGAGGRSAVITVVDRHSRALKLGAIPGTDRAPATAERLVELFAPVPAELRRTLTWDQGWEMAQWAELEQALPGSKVFFCHPHHPWERPSNEHTNRTLRYWLPKGTDLSVHTQADLDRLAHYLNNTPRRLLNWATPAEVYARAAMH